MKEKEEAEEKNGKNSGKSEATIPENLKQEFRRTLCLLEFRCLGDLPHNLPSLSLFCPLWWGH